MPYAWAAIVVCVLRVRVILGRTSDIALLARLAINSIRSVDLRHHRRGDPPPLITSAAASVIVSLCIECFLALCMPGGWTQQPPAGDDQLDKGTDFGDGLQMGLSQQRYISRHRMGTGNPRLTYVFALYRNRPQNSLTGPCAPCRSSSAVSPCLWAWLSGRAGWSAGWSDWRAIARDRLALGNQGRHPVLLGRGEDGRAPQDLSLGPGQTRLGAFHQEIALELGNGIDHSHRHLTGGTGEIDTPERQAVHPDPEIRQGRDSLADIDGVAAQPAQLGDNQDIPRLHLVQEL